MAHLASSKKTLEMLCKEQPDKFLSDGTFKTIIGVIAETIGLGLGNCLITNWDRIPHYDMSAWLSYTALATIGSIAGLSTGFYLIADGLSSLTKPFTSPPKSDITYTRNSGYTNTPTKSDKIFGTPIIPITNVSELEQNIGKTVLINGITLNDIQTQDDQKFSPYHPLSLHPITVYTINIKGKYKSKSIILNLNTRYRDLAENISQRDEGSVVYVIGEVKNKNTITINTIEDAY